MKSILFVIGYVIFGIIGAYLWIKCWKEDNKITFSCVVIAAIAFCSGYVGFFAAFITDVLYKEARKGKHLSKYLEVNNEEGN